MRERKWFITGEQVMSLGTMLMIGGALLGLVHIILWLWFPISDITIKITGTGMVGGFLIAIIGLFLPNNW